MSQTTYNVEPGLAIQGMLGDFDASVKSSLSRANEEASSVEFGRPAVTGTDAETQFLLPSAAAQPFLGITVFQQATEDVTDDGIATDETAELLTRGRIWVKVFEAIAVGEDVYYQHTANLGAVPGDWRNDADSANASQLTQARWLTGADAGELALLEINVP